MPRHARNSRSAPNGVPPQPPVAPATRNLDGPVFGQPEPTADPSTFKVNHPSDGPAYMAIDQLNKQGRLKAMPFDAPRGSGVPRRCSRVTIDLASRKRTTYAANNLGLPAMAQQTRAKVKTPMRRGKSKKGQR